MEDSVASGPRDYSSEVIRSGKNRGWRKQLSEKVSGWEDELPSPHSDSGRAGGEGMDEAVTSFIHSDEEDGAVVNAPSSRHSPLERSKSSSTEEEIREKVEDSMHGKLRDWKNMTAESVTGE